MNPPCNSQQGFDMPIDAPAVLDSTVADMDAAPHCWYALCNLPRVDYSGMEANLAHTEHAFRVGNIFVPQTLKQAKSCPDSMLWEKAMNEELESLSSNDIFTVCNLPK